MSGFTRIPNNILDDAKLNPYQFQIFSIIVRKTDGWCKTSDGISLSQFLKLITFKKPKLISTLKELENQGYIKITHTIRSNGGKSYNMYSVSDKIVSKYNNDVVTEDYKGSNSELQGVVTEDYIQKKAITKETTTSLKNKQKENPQSKKISLNTQIENKIAEYQNINISALNEWLKIKKFKAIAPVTKILNMLSEYDKQTQQEIVDASIMNGYKGLFAPKQQKQQYEPFNTPQSQTLNTDVNVWDMIEQQEEPQQNDNQGTING